MPPPPAASAGSLPPPLLAVDGFLSFGDVLADFLRQWNSILLDAAAIAAALPAATVPSPGSGTKPDPAPRAEPKPEPEPAPRPRPRPSAPPDRENGRRLKGGDPSEVVLGLICKRMDARGFRRFVTAHLRDRSWLRRVGPGALRRAPDPAALVFRAVGRYYIYPDNGDAEAAGVILLELYVRAGCPRRTGQAELWAEAREAALSWRSRIVDGRRNQVANARAVDALGLILLMAAFGVPVEFPAMELYDLYLAAVADGGGGLGLAKLLKCSQLFVKNIRGIVADMLNEGIYHEAISIILAFELQEVFPLAATLTCMIEKFDHYRKKLDTEGQHCLAALKRHDEEELVLLRSISKYLEDHQLCSSEISCVSIAKKILLLEERFENPIQALKGTKRKRTTGKDNLECTEGPKCPYASVASNLSHIKKHLG